jgi:large subunit ribosomal protein L29
VKGVQANDLRGNDPDELRRTVRKLEEDLFKNRLKKNTNQLENTMLIRNARREIARVNTVLGEKLRGVTVTKKAPAAPTGGGGEPAPKRQRAAKKQSPTSTDGQET